jgi:hypothetical protein
LTLFSRSTKAHYTIEIVPTTKITLAQFASSLADMAVGDHLTATGKLDVVNVGIGPNPIIAKTIKISSPSFGGVITGITPASAGGVALTVKARHGHLLRIDAPGQILVYSVIGGSQQNGRVLDLFVGEHISAKGSRAGKFELLASAIHVYPHQHTVGGTVASVLPGVYRIVASDGKQYIIHTNAKTSYTLNGKLATRAVVLRGRHIRVRGYDALLSAERGFPTIIAAHVSVTVHVTKPKVKTPTAKKQATPGTTAALASAPTAAYAGAGSRFFSSRILSIYAA